MIWDGEYAIVW